MLKPYKMQEVHMDWVEFIKHAEHSGIALNSDKLSEIMEEADVELGPEGSFLEYCMDNNIGFSPVDVISTNMKEGPDFDDPKTAIFPTFDLGTQDDPDSIVLLSLEGPEDDGVVVCSSVKIVSY